MVKENSEWNRSVPEVFLTASALMLAAFGHRSEVFLSAEREKKPLTGFVPFMENLKSHGILKEFNIFNSAPKFWQCA